MAYQRSKICLLFAGGTQLIGRSKTPIEVHRHDQMNAWLGEVPEVQIIAKIDPFFVQAETPATRLPETWTHLAQEIKKRYEQYDGFVILQPLDVLAYSGAAMSFILQHLGKPVILTGSQHLHGGDQEKPIAGFGDFRRLGLRANLINAVQVVTMDLSGVAVMFGNRLLRGTQARRSFEQFTNTRETLIGELGRVDFGIKLNDRRERRRKTGIVVYPKIEKNVAILRQQPGAEPITLVETVKPSTAGIFLHNDGLTLTDTQLKQLDRYSHAKACPIIIFRADNLDVSRYPHIIIIRDITEESAIVKVMWALGQSKSRARLRELIGANIAGEFAIEGEQAS